MNVEGTVDKYPIDPSPCRELVSCGVERILDSVSDDKYPIEPRPCSELVSCGVERILDKERDDKYPIDPSPCSELVKIALVAVVVVDTYWADPNPVTVEASSSGSMKVVI